MQGLPVRRRLRGTRAVRAVASPVRLEIIEFLQAHGPASVAALASGLGRAPDSLYYHLRELQATGFVMIRQPHGTTRGPGRNGAIVRLTAVDFAVGSAAPAPREQAARQRAVQAILRQAYREWAAGGGGLVQRWKAWLSPAEAARAEDLLARLGRLLTARSPHREGASLFAFTGVFLPLHAKTRKRS